MKKFYLLTLSLMMFLPVSVMAQNKIKGTILESKSSLPLPFSTIAIYESDTVLVAGTTSDDNGLYEISNIKSGDYRVEASFIGYKTSTSHISINNNSVTLDFALEQDTEYLEGAKVSARKPLIEMKVDKIVMNVADAVATQGSNAKEILRKAPGVSIDMEGNVKLNGSAVAVWIDGRPSHLSGKSLEAFLESTDGATIDRIEVMAHPSSKYDAQGSGGIIDIKTKKNFLQGFNGSVNGRFGGMVFKDDEKGHRFDHSGGGGVLLGYRTEKVNVTANYTESRGNSKIELSTETFMDPIRLKSVSLVDNKSEDHNAKVTIDWFIDKKNTIGAIVQGNVGNQFTGSPTGRAVVETFLDNTLLYRQKSFINTYNDGKNIIANLNYTHIFDEKKSQEITINGDIAFFRDGNNGDQANRYQDLGYENPADVIFRTNGLQNISMYSVKADYQQLIAQKGMLEAGAKFVTTNTANESLREDFIKEVWQKNPSLSSLFDYRESVAAAYVSASYMVTPQFSLKGGLRGEYTFSNGDWKSASEKSNRRYFNLFPTFFAGYNISQNAMLALSYTYRIGRPSYSRLNPQRVYVDATSNLEGNPKLQPEFTHQVSLTAILIKHLSITLLYQRTNDQIIQSPGIDYEKGENVIKWSNFGSMTFTGGAISLSEMPITNWLTVNASINDLFNISRDYSGTYRRTGNMFNANAQFTFLLPKEWKIEIGARYVGGVYAGYLKTHPQYNSFGGVKKDFLDGRATIALNCTNLLLNSGVDVEMYNGDKMVSMFKQDFNEEKITLSFSYRFGTVKTSRQRKVGNLEETSRVGGGSGIGN